MGVGHVSKALKVQCYAWTHIAHMHEFMSVHTVCWNLSIAITAYRHIIH